MLASSSMRPQVDLEEIALQNTIKRATELAKSQIVGVLGRKPFTKVRIGRTDLDLGKTAQLRGGYSVSNLFTSTKLRATEDFKEGSAAFAEKRNARFTST